MNEDGMTAELADELARDLVTYLQDIRANPRWVALNLIESGWRKEDPA